MAEPNATETVWDALFADLKKDITASKPASLLLFAIPNLDMKEIERMPNTVPLKSTEDLTQYLKSPPAERKFDLAVCILAAEDVGNPNHTHLISKLRDTDCARVYLACSVSAATTDSNYDDSLRALGFKRLRIYGAPPADKKSIHLYYHDSYDYKEVPDWLNNRFWANPDMWNKTRW